MQESPCPKHGPLGSSVISTRVVAENSPKHFPKFGALSFPIFRAHIISIWS